MRPRSLDFRAISLAAALLLPTPALAAWPHVAGVNLSVSPPSNYATSPVAISDNAGGAIVTWQQAINPSGSGVTLYAAHVEANGTLDPLWPAGGAVVGVSSGSGGYGISGEVLVLDSLGGFFVAWGDYRSGGGDIYMQHIQANGSPYAGWPANGLLVGATTSGPTNLSDFSPQIAADSTGGAYVVWTSIYTYPTDYDVWATHVTAAGGVVSGWPLSVDFTTGVQDEPAAATDANGDLLVVYEYNYSGSNYTIHPKVYAPAGGAPLFDLTLTPAAGTSWRYPIMVSSPAYGQTVLFMQLSPTASLGYAPFSAQNPLNFSPYMVPAAPAPSGNTRLSAIPDEGGGYFVRYGTSSVGVVTHLTSGFTNWPGWSSSGITVTPYERGLVADGSGGVIVANVTSAGQPGLDRFLAGGGLAPGWSYPTTMLDTYVAYGQSVVTDGKGGAITFWSAARGPNNGVYGQEVDHFGALGGNAPAIASVRDVPLDQGGHVRVSWTHSPTDADPVYGVAQYFVFRQAPAAIAAAARRGAVTSMSAADFAATAHAPGAAAATAVPGRLLAWPDGAQVTYWEQVATVAPQALTGYSVVATTTADSVPAGNAYTLFMVEATGANGGYWMSAADSGYSVDNLAPASPAPFTASFARGAGTILTWGANAESDLAGYRLYKGSNAAFAPGPGNRIAQLSGATTYTDAAPLSGWYKLSAYDIHGNESPFATVLPAGTTGVGDAPPRELAFAITSPNPSHGALAMRLDLPRDGAVRVGVYDATGRLVRRVADGEYAAGSWSLRWDGATATGEPAPSGLYFARVGTPGDVLVRRFALTR